MIVCACILTCIMVTRVLALQALFEGAMYIFVLQWPPALKAALGAGVAVPFGKIFSCFMVRAAPASLPYHKPS